MRKLLVMLFFFFIFLSSFGDNGFYSVNSRVLPAQSKEFLSTYFPNNNITSVFFNQGSYQVILNGNIIAYFTLSGNWMRVSGNGSVIPNNSFLDTSVVNSINQNFNGASITSVSRTQNGGYRARLNNNTDVTLSSNGDIIKQKQF